MSYYDDRYDNRYGEVRTRPSLPHSGLGNVSFAIAVVVDVGGLGLLVIAGLAGDHLDDEHPAAILMGLAFIGFGLLALVGAILGGIGLSQRRRNTVFAILGLILNGLLVLGVIGLVVVGALSD